MKPSILRNVLAFAGVIPFVVSAMALLSGHRSLPIVGDIEFAVIAYGVIIATFMSGAHWGQHLHLNAPWVITLPIISNLITVVLWFAFLTQAPQFITLHLIIVLVSQLVVDAMLFKYTVIEKSYFITRCLVTSIVSVSLLCVWYAL